jgi:hypothetical protein
MPSLAGLAMSGAAPEDSGIASGLFNTVQQVGSALGLAVLSTLAASRTTALLGHGPGAAAALTDGYRLAFRVGASFVVAALVLAAAVLRPAAARTAGVRAEQAAEARTGRVAAARR